MHQGMGPHENDTHVESSLVQVHLGKQFDSIDIRRDGTSILSSSNMSTRYWTGNLAVFSNPDSLGLVTGCKLSLDFDAGIPSAKFIGDTSRVLLALDSGYLNMVKIDADVAAESAVLASVCEHDDVVSAMDVSSDFSRALTGSYDRSLKLWDTAHLVCSATYRPAHGQAVLSASFHPQDPNLGVSCAEDGDIKLWDFRLPRPSTKLMGSFCDRASFATFRGGNSRNLLIGTVSGDILEVQPGAQAPLLHLGAHKRPIRKICSAPNNPNLVASCADEEKTSVFSLDSNSPRILYSDERHEDFVRGLSWSRDGRLFSCGWDRRVVCHDVSTSTHVA